MRVGYLVMQNKEKYLQRIKKLLAMSRNNSSAEEAALALRHAQRLMETHQLTEADATLLDINEASTNKSPSQAKTMPEYMALLAIMVARVFGVKHYLSFGQEQAGKPAKRTITYYGPGERPQIAAYSFEVLGRQLTNARREYIASLRKNIKTSTKTARADTFCSAWVEGAYYVVTDFVVSDTESALIESNRIKNLSVGMKTLETRKPGKARGVDIAAVQGFSTGQKVQLLHGVNGNESVRIGSNK